jgi:hypothetical protein
MKAVLALALMAVAAKATDCPKVERTDLPDTPVTLLPGQSYDYESAKSGDAGVFKIAIPSDIHAYIDLQATNKIWLYMELSDNNGAGTGVNWQICYPNVGQSSAGVPAKPCNDTAGAGTESNSRWTTEKGDVTVWFDVSTAVYGAADDTIWIFLNPTCEGTSGCIKTNEWNVNFGFSHQKVASSTSDAFNYWGYDNQLHLDLAELPSEFVLQNNVRTASFKTKLNPNQDQDVYFTGTTESDNVPVYLNVRVPTASKGVQLVLYVGNATHVDPALTTTYKYPKFTKTGNWDNYEAPYTAVSKGTYKMMIRTVANDEVALGNWAKWTAKAGYGTPPCDSATSAKASLFLFALLPLTWVFNRM